jgi:DNA-binding CsgD family transcriptional regulator
VTRVGVRPALSPRETDVVRALARGRTNAEIAAELVVSLATVKTHVGNVAAKLSARNRVEIAVWAWEQGLVRRPSAAVLGPAVGTVTHPCRVCPVSAGPVAS